MVKKIIKRLLPAQLILLYHYAMAVLAGLLYGFPSRKMVIIGVTGTKGKTSTVNFIWSCLMAGGNKTGIISTANIRINKHERLNKYHMTMPGPFVLQKLMARMAQDGCTHCIIETTSEGIQQHRHVGIYYDIAVFTNLFPEHLQAHGGSFETYKQMKGRMFTALSSHRKRKNGKPVKKVIIANRDSEHADYFLSFPADKHITFGVRNKANFFAHTIKETTLGVNFMVGKAAFSIGILGAFNVSNALPAIIIARHIGMNDNTIARGLANLITIPGRMEKISGEQNFTVIVDYAHEKESMTHVLRTAQSMRSQGAKTIVLLGAEGGGRDKAKRPIMGELASRMADYVIVSNVDPYEDNPKEILEDIARSSEQHGKIREQDLFIIEDRREGIRKALSLATTNDIVLITGKGAEQSIIIGGKKSFWDDRLVVQEELQNL